jgi:hypothetical protein
MRNLLLFIKSHKKLFYITTPLILILVVGVTSYVFVLSKVASENASNITFEKTLSNNFVNPHISAKISGNVKPGDEVKIDDRDGVGTLSINGTNYSLSIVLFSFEFDSAIQYESVTKIQNEKISNLMRTQDPKDWYMEGFYGWHYTNVLDNGECTITSSGIPVDTPCGSAKLELGNLRFDVACNVKGDSNLVKECDEIMKSLSITY